MSPTTTSAVRTTSVSLETQVDDLLITFEGLLVMKERGLISLREYSNALTHGVLRVHQHVMQERTANGASTFIAHADGTVTQTTLALG